MGATVPALLTLCECEGVDPGQKPSFIRGCGRLILPNHLSFTYNAVVPLRITLTKE